MHDEVMDAQHPVIFADAGDDLLDDIRIRRLAQQLIERAADEGDAGEQDERRHQDAHVAIQVEMDERRDDRGQQDAAGPQHIGKRIRRRRLHHRRMDQRAIMPVIGIHPQLHQDRDAQHDDRCPGKHHFLGIEDLAHALLGQLDAQKQDQHRHQQRGQTLIARMTEGVFGIRRLARQMKAHQRNDRAAGIRQIVDRIRRDGDAVGDRPRRKFKQT